MEYNAQHEMWTTTIFISLNFSFLLEIASYGICNFVLNVSGKISHSFTGIFAKSIVIEG